MKQPCISWYRTFQALSLDVVTGAIVFSLALDKYYLVPVSWRIITCLAIAIWLIYTCDHLLDARKIKGATSIFRHQFHKEHQKVLIIAAILLFAISIINAYYLPAIVLYSGIIVSFLTGVYFLLLQHKAFWTKEICVAILYTAGIFIGPVCFSYQHLELVQYLLIPQVFLLVLANLLIFSWFDILKDKKNGHSSMIIHLGIQHSEKIIKLILTAELLSTGVFMLLNISLSTLIMQIIIAMMYGSLALIFTKDKLFRSNDSYRIIGDGIFFLPILFLLYVGLC